MIPAIRQLVTLEIDGRPYVLRFDLQTGQMRPVSLIRPVTEIVGLSSGVCVSSSDEDGDEDAQPMLGCVGIAELRCGFATE